MKSPSSLEIPSASHVSEIVRQFAALPNDITVFEGDDFPIFRQSQKLTVLKRKFGSRQGAWAG